jgi:ABC-type bacteriocin/lantibiotic exporter with double-glycine peptidase domain
MPDSIKNNISLSSNIIDEARVIESLKKTNCLNFVNKLKEGINHKLNEDGKNFSSGQIQRLALARTLYFDSDIIILDEPTSSLDITAEENFVRLIKTLKNFKTIIIISHKYKTLKNCEKIYRLNKNKLILVKKNP